MNTRNKTCYILKGVLVNLLPSCKTSTLANTSYNAHNFHLPYIIFDTLQKEITFTMDFICKDQAHVDFNLNSLNKQLET